MTLRKKAQLQRTMPKHPPTIKAYQLKRKIPYSLKIHKLVLSPTKPPPKKLLKPLQKNKKKRNKSQLHQGKVKVRPLVRKSPKHNKSKSPNYIQKQRSLPPPPPIKSKSL